MRFGIPTAAAALAADDARDQRLADLLTSLTDARRLGRPFDLDAATHSDPDLADELRQLWAAVGVADELASWPPADQTSDWAETSSGLGAPWSTGPDDEPSRIGRYELLGELGRGGMGVVHLARQVDLGRVVAVKRLLRGASASPDDVARFRAEATSAARLAHPHVVRVHDVGVEDETPFLVMEYIAGTTLARVLADGPLPPERAASLLEPICRGVAHAHERGVLHRDLKPSNILIDESGRPLVGDFGLAKRIDLGDEGPTITGAILGSPSYMAPEQASSRRSTVGPAADVYSLGAILYQMLTGRPPFQSASPLDTLLLVLEQDPVPPRILNPRANRDLEMVALKCLQKRPEDRYTSAEALADDLAAFRAGQPVSARSTRFRALAGRYLGETPHASLLENWGELWMYHSVALLVFYAVTWTLLARGVTSHWPYFAIFTVGLGAWAALFWQLRKRRGGPVTFVERHLAHIWGAGVLGVNLFLVAEWLLGWPVMTLAPLLTITNGMLFVVKGGLLSGEFYIQAGLLFLTLIPATLHPHLAIPLFAVVSAACFFVTGLKYHRRYLRVRRDERGRRAGVS